MRAVLVLVMTIQGGLAYANTDARVVKRQSDAVNELVQERADSLSESELSDILRSLQRIRSVVEGNQPPPPPPNGGPRYAATCHIDDDPNFDFDQNVVGTIRAETIQILVSECAAIAQSTYGSRGSSGIKEIVLNQNAANVIYHATCHVDDDPNFDYDQVIAGQVGGATIETVHADCATLAEMLYGSQGSSGIKDLTVSNNLPPHYNTAECHIDDDPNFDFDQVVAGTLASATVAGVIEDCARLAEDQYGSQGSSGVKGWNEGRTPGPFVSSAECHVDDDPNFDFDQIIVGRLFGSTVSEITEGCALIAESMYGNAGSSGIRDIQ